MPRIPKPLLLHNAVRRGSVSAVKNLVKTPGAAKERDPTTGNTALHEAACVGNTACVEALLPHSIPQMVNLKRQTALCIASAAGDLATVKVFFKNRNARKFLGMVRRSMRVASSSEIIFYLSTIVPDIVEMRRGGRMALVYAAEDGRVDTVNGLLNIGVEPKKARREGKSAAMYAAQNGHVDCLRLLLDKGINIGHTDMEGHTMLHLAAMKGSTECIELLVTRGANLHARNCYKMTAMHIAAKERHTQTVQLLLRLGADRMRRDKMGQTPLQLAKLAECKEIVDLLQL